MSSPPNTNSQSQIKIKMQLPNQASPQYINGINYSSYDLNHTLFIIFFKSQYKKAGNSIKERTRETHLSSPNNPNAIRDSLRLILSKEGQNVGLENFRFAWSRSSTEPPVSIYDFNTGKVEWDNIYAFYLVQKSDESQLSISPSSNNNKLDYDEKQLSMANADKTLKKHLDFAEYAALKKNHRLYVSAKYHLGIKKEKLDDVIDIIRDGLGTTNNIKQKNKEKDDKNGPNMMDSMNKMMNNMMQMQYMNMMNNMMATTQQTQYQMPSFSPFPTFATMPKQIALGPKNSSKTKPISTSKPSGYTGYHGPSSHVKDQRYSPLNASKDNDDSDCEITKVSLPKLM